MLSFFFPSFENDFTPFFMYFALSFEDKRIIPTYITKKKNDIINSVFVIPLNIGAIHINSKNADANKEKNNKGASINFPIDVEPFISRYFRLDNMK